MWINPVVQKWAGNVSKGLNMCNRNVSISYHFIGSFIYVLKEGTQQLQSSTNIPFEYGKQGTYHKESNKN